MVEDVHCPSQYPPNQVQYLVLVRVPFGKDIDWAKIDSEEIKKKMARAQKVRIFFQFISVPLVKV